MTCYLRAMFCRSTSLAAFLLLLEAGSPGVSASKPAEPSAESRRWVEETLASLSVEEKVGQMLAARIDGSFHHRDDPELTTLENAVAAGHVGGIVLFAGEPGATARLSNRLQARARLPLLIASDYEWGAAMRVAGATQFPRAMALGAAGDASAAEAIGRITAREAKALGIRLVLAPVLDLALSAENTVINTRSFGESPEKVGELGSAFIRGLQEGGVLATAKHFPGHGATEDDSHFGLAILHRGRDRLRELELAPFQQAIDADVAAVMPGHIALPSIDGRSDRPATQSPEILHGLLREEMGFEGLIVSDALDMEGARKGSWDGRVAVQTVLAGVDLLLVPPRLEVARRALLRAVERGELTEERIDRSVRRLLVAKARVGLHQQRLVDLDEIDSLVGDPESASVADRIAERAITLLRRRPASARGRIGGLGPETVPFSSRTPPRILLVDFLRDSPFPPDPRTLSRELARRAGSVEVVLFTPRTATLAGHDVETLSRTKDVTVLAHYGRNSDWSAEEGGLLSRLRRLIAAGRPVVLLALADPWVLTSLPEASAHFALYDSSPASQRSAARALFGEIGASGRLPVALSPTWLSGHHQALPSPRRLIEADDPRDVGMSGEGLEEAVSLLRGAVTERVTPGAVALVARRGKIVLHEAVGHLSYAPGAVRTRLSTLYDLASLTKVVATTTVAMHLVESGQLDLERKVQDYVPEFQGEGKERIAVADLLTHSSGMLWWTDLWARHGHLNPTDAKKAYLEEIFELPLVDQPGVNTTYSDLGILLLGEILERAGGLGYEALVRREVLDPLAMTDSSFAPPPSARARIAPTEVDGEWRKRLVHGEVHDENAFGLGGVAPHAGLFSTASDLAKLAQTLLNGGTYNGHRFLNGTTIQRFTRRAGRVGGSSRALGWDTPFDPSSSGAYFSSDSFGHTGFTGTSIWIDPRQELFVILLTNRVHPTRENREIVRLRPLFHDAVMNSIIDHPVDKRQE